MNLAAELRVGEVVAGEDGPHDPPEFFQSEVDRVLGAAALRKAAEHLVGLGGPQPERGGVPDHLVCRYFTAVPFAHAPGASCATTKASDAWPNVGAGSRPIMPGLLAAGNAYRSRVACPGPPQATIVRRRRGRLACRRESGISCDNAGEFLILLLPDVRTICASLAPNRYEHRPSESHGGIVYARPYFRGRAVCRAVCPRAYIQIGSLSHAMNGKVANNFSSSYRTRSGCFSVRASWSARSLEEKARVDIAASSGLQMDSAFPGPVPCTEGCGGIICL